MQLQYLLCCILMAGKTIFFLYMFGPPFEISSESVLFYSLMELHRAVIPFFRACRPLLPS